MNKFFQELMRKAARLTRTGRLKEATEAIQRALSGARAPPRPPPAATQHPTESSGNRGADQAAPHNVVDGGVVEVDAPAAPKVPDGAAPRAAPLAAPATPATPAAPAATPAATPRAAPGTFTQGSHTHAALSRDYKLYAPPGAADRTLPLVVMLHGCTQNPDDFAAGTGMNEHAAGQGFFVLYPAQSHAANPQRCWNWFKHNHQQRGSGEPALLAGMTQAVMAQHGIDPRRVYIAGLSAGGAMAAVVADAYPEIFAAVGVHSGLPAGAARSVAEAMSVMLTGATGAGHHASSSVPTIAFHGDQDRTVHPRNGEQVVAAVLTGAPGVVQGDARRAARPRVEQGASIRGQRYTRSTHLGDDGAVLAEHWLVHGAGHAWSGGLAEGSYTDAAGPDATREMLRFFLDHPKAAERRPISRPARRPQFHVRCRTDGAPAQALQRRS
jgi:poly(hydroxyalkanoate) depolymerase family esterase